MSPILLAEVDVTNSPTEANIAWLPLIADI